MKKRRAVSSGQPSISDRQLGRLRLLLNQAILIANREINEGAVTGSLQRIDKGSARISLDYRGTEAAERSLWLADVADAIRNEIRLEQSQLKESLYSTSESRFQIDPTLHFEFDISLTSSGIADSEAPLTGPRVPGEPGE